MIIPVNSQNLINNLHNFHHFEASNQKFKDYWTCNLNFLIQFVYNIQNTHLTKQISKI